VRGLKGGGVTGAGPTLFRTRTLGTIVPTHPHTHTLTHTTATQLLAIDEDDELGEVELAGFDSGRQTLLCSNTLFDTLLQVRCLQREGGGVVTEESVRFVEPHSTTQQHPLNPTTSGDRCSSEVD